MILDKFLTYIDEKSLCNSDQEVMLAVSGGIDSVVMTDLFYRAGYKFSILHCNFGLRAEESDADEAFVRSLAAGYEMPVFIKLFDTEEYAVEQGISIQMAARKLRYDWFNEISTKNGVDIIATAHNMNDNVETVIINLARGTGIKGLTGIPVKNEKFIRPLLSIDRTEIADYSRQYNLKYREDSSNSSRKYHRNKIRHDVIPLLEEVNPSFVSTMNENIAKMSGGYAIFHDKIETTRSSLFIRNSNHYQIDVSRLKALAPLQTWLYELFSVYNFTKDQCLGIEQILNSNSGKQCISTTHRLYKDREMLLLFEVEEESFERYYIDTPGSRASLPFAMDIDVVSSSEAGDFPVSQQTAFIDYDRLTFPLVIRKWQHGDYFFPLGMDQMKKVSDFFIDEKIPVPIKKTTWILASGKNIVWIMGLRIDNRYKITKKTSQVLKLQIYS